jgi:hypothetical protein
VEPGIKTHLTGIPALAEHKWENKTPSGVKHLLIPFFQAAWCEYVHFVPSIMLIRPSLDHACPEIEQIPWLDIENCPAEFYDMFLYDFSIQLRHPLNTFN